MKCDLDAELEWQAQTANRCNLETSDLSDALWLRRQATLSEPLAARERRPRN